MTPTMRTLKPIIGGGAHATRVGLLLRLAAASELTYDRYAPAADGEGNAYVLTHPDVGEFELLRSDAEMFLAGYCAWAQDLDAHGAPLPSALPRAVSVQATKEESQQYYGFDQRRTSGQRVVRFPLDAPGPVLVRRDHAVAFLLGHLTAALSRHPADQPAMQQMLLELTAPAAAPLGAPR